QQACLVAFAEQVELRFGQTQIGELEGQHFAGSQSVQQNQAHDGEVAKAMEAAPEAADIVRGKGLNETARFGQVQALGDGAAPASITDRGLGIVNALERGLFGEIAKKMETEQVAHQ